jgi:LmbE family N-acetylglucosaminyl deacetylase
MHHHPSDRDVEVIMRILTILAHPDDAEIWVGGTIIKHTERGDEAVVCTFEENEGPRITEAVLGAELMGAEVTILDKNLLHIREHSVIEVERVIKSFLPDILITHWEQDTHYEHRLVQDIVMQAIFSPKIATSYPRALLACDTYNSIGLKEPFSPTIFVDVSQVWDNKINAIRVHQSQPVHFWEDMASCLGKLQGSRCGCEYAEAYHQLPILGRYTPCSFLSDAV